LLVSGCALWLCCALLVHTAQARKDVPADGSIIIPGSQRGIPDPARADAVVRASRDAWMAYDCIAMGSDELRPISKNGSNSLGGLGGTVVESLSTLWMLGLTEEYARCVST
jgi:hypothetical protein